MTAIWPAVRFLSSINPFYAMSLSVTLANVLGVLVGAGLLALSGWAWAGRSRSARWWVGRPFGTQLMLAVAPGMGLILLGVGVVTLAGTSVALVVTLPVLFGAVLELAGIFALLPRWWGPRWYRELPSGRRDYDTTRSALAAAMVGYLGQPGVTSAAEAAAHVGGAQPVASWHGGWVYDADTGERVHATSRKGTIDGRLTLYPTALVFAASRFEDTLRGTSTVVLVDVGDITDLRVVPPRAGADGRPRRGWMYRSLFPRLVVRTGDGAHVFDVAWGRAGALAQRLAALAPTDR